MNSTSTPSLATTQKLTDSAVLGGQCYPSLSVVICTRNRPASLKACVCSVADQTVHPMELIVVDDGRLSDEDLKSISGFCESAGMAFKYLRKDVPGLPASRNLGVRQARGDIIQFLDDDVSLDPEFCREILRLYAEDLEGSLLGAEGTLVPSSQPSLGAQVTECVYRMAGWWALRPRPCCRPRPPAFVHDLRRAVPTLKIVGATMSFRRSALLEEPFDEQLAGYALGEDRDMAYRLGRCGWIVRSRAAKAVHHHDVTSRPDAYAFGRMAVRNYARIMKRNGLTGVGERLVIGYSFAIIGLSLLAFALVKPRRYLPELLGMLAGGMNLARGFIKETILGELS